MAATGQAPTATEYMVHHLTHLSTAKQKVIVDFSIVNFDTVFFSVLILCITLWILRSAARRATSGVPGKFQACALLVNFVFLFALIRRWKYCSDETVPNVKVQGSNELANK